MVLHAILIVLSFMWVAKLRSLTDLIPFVQLRIPLIDTHETLIFGLIAAGIFVLT